MFENYNRKRIYFLKRENNFVKKKLANYLRNREGIR